MTPSSLPLAVTLPSATPVPSCSSALQPSIHHAERLVDVLRAHEQRARSGDVWLTGRADELQCFVLAVATDCERGRRSEQDAQRAIDDYLDDLHRLLAPLYRHELPGCCQAVTEKVDLQRLPGARKSDPAAASGRGVTTGEDADATGV